MKNLDELKQVFFIECAELLSDMEERLLKLDEGTQDKEPLNAIFRCAHSIKGGSGAFGLDAVMQFTHTMEALLDIMRDGKVLATREAIDLLLKAADIVSQMLAAAKAGQAIAEGMGNEVKAGLQRLTRGAGAASYAPPPPQAAVANPAASGECEYDIVFSPRSGLFERGNEPLLILRELDKMGNMQVEIDTAKIPPFDEFDPAQIKLSWTIKLQTQHPESLINEVFEFENLVDQRYRVLGLQLDGPAELNLRRVKFIEWRNFCSIDFDLHVPHFVELAQDQQRLVSPFEQSTARRKDNIIFAFTAGGGVRHCRLRRRWRVRCRAGASRQAL